MQLMFILNVAVYLAIAYAVQDIGWLFPLMQWEPEVLIFVVILQAVLLPVWLLIKVMK